MDPTFSTATTIDEAEAELLAEQQEFLKSPQEFKNKSHFAGLQIKNNLDQFVNSPKAETCARLIKDIFERTNDGPVTAPKQSIKTGFPSPKNLLIRSSKNVTKPKSMESDYSESRLKSEIDAENMNNLKNMSDREIQDARIEIEKTLSPDLIAMLRARQQDPRQSIPKKNTANNDQDERIINYLKEENVKPGEWKEIGEPVLPFVPEDIIVNPALNIHFPRPQSTQGSLDLSSPTFLQDLKDKYFPTLSHDPSKLSWMKETDQTEYLPSSNIEVSALRYDFSGRLIPPKLAMEIPVTHGLHHHSSQVAGYTIKELIQQSLSTVPGQRCFGLQTLGRILYRVGKNGYAEITDDIKLVVEKEGVMFAVEMALGDRHLSVQSYATEAAWLARLGRGETM
ncbi:RNA polymerase II-associated protein RBA50 [Neolecta irregularis DAH-3]|uniref:RNA polymerase II-associated protein RBA50 n=1 Tax=Neolecta irregularis (strain DAH-3) TaxID=1198029 RepID=A0A1U7LGW7_NEOID|nr:RNA polymerase II-associated protein RBA50 [Neolecta irregularis DAH-3]|eukprot:OLL21889.1 RNA polymerase II-associated protein RBA50 [Neolecta irregularis DAH-3]